MSTADLTKPNTPALQPLAVGDAEAARLLSVSTRTLFNWRTDGSGPRWVKVGGRVLYAVDELRRWLAEAAGSLSGPKFPAEQGIFRGSPAMQANSTPPATQQQTGEQPAIQAISEQSGGAS